LFSVAFALIAQGVQAGEIFQVNGGYALNSFQWIDSNYRRFLVQHSLNHRDRQFERYEPNGERL